MLGDCEAAIYYLIHTCGRELMGVFSCFVSNGAHDRVLRSVCFSSTNIIFTGIITDLSLGWLSLTIDLH